MGDFQLFLLYFSNSISWPSNVNINDSIQNNSKSIFNFVGEYRFIKKIYH